MLARPSSKGAAVGLILAGLIIIAASTHILQGTEFEGVFRFLAATPLLAFELVRDAPDSAQWLLLVAWLSSVGAALSWSISQGGGGLLFAAMMMLAVVSGHVQTEANVGNQIEGSMTRMSQGVSGLIQPSGN